MRTPGKKLEELRAKWQRGTSQFLHYATEGRHLDVIWCTQCGTLIPSLLAANAIECRKCRCIWRGGGHPATDDQYFSWRKWRALRRLWILAGTVAILLGVAVIAVVVTSVIWEFHSLWVAGRTTLVMLILAVIVVGIAFSGYKLVSLIRQNTYDPFLWDKMAEIRRMREREPAVHRRSRNGMNEISEKFEQIRMTDPLLWEKIEELQKVPRNDPLYQKKMEDLLKMKREKR